LVQSVGSTNNVFPVLSVNVIFVKSSLERQSLPAAACFFLHPGAISNDNKMNSARFIRENDPLTVVYVVFIFQGIMYRGRLFRHNQAGYEPWLIHKKLQRDFLQ